MGAPAAGKSSCAAEAFARLRDDGHPVELVSEFAREFISANGGINHAYEQVYLAREQRRREEILARNPKTIVLSDSPFLINHVYCGLLTGKQGRKKSPEGTALMMQTLYTEFLDALRVYDLIFFVEKPETGTQSDGIRIHTQSESKTIERIMLAFLDMHGGPDWLVKGDLSYKERAAFIVKKIKEAM